MQVEPAGWRWCERLLFITGSCVLVHPIFSSAYYFTVDGPSHVYTASLLIGQGAMENARLWEVNPLPVPNWTGHALLALMQLVLAPTEALKVLHAIILLSFPITFRAWAIHRKARIPWTAHLAFPFGITSMFSMGFYNFCLGLPLFIGVIWAWERTSRNTFGSWVVLAVLLLVLYFTHMLPFGFAVAYLGVQAAMDLAYGLLRKDSIHVLLRRPLALALCLIPSLALLGIYMLCSPEQMTPGEGAAARWALWRPYSITSSAAEVILWSGAVMCMLLILVLPGRGERNSGDVSGHPPRVYGLVAFSLVTVLLLACVPDTLGLGSDTVPRMMILAHVWLLAILPFHKPMRWVGVWVSVAAIGITIGMESIRGADRGGLSKRLRHCTELAASVPRGAVVATLHFNWWEAHVFDLGLAQRGVVHLSNYELIHDHFPLRWTSSVSTTRTLAFGDPLDVLHPYSGVAGKLLREADHILVVGQPTNDEQREHLQFMLDELENSHHKGDSNESCWSLNRR